MAKKVGQRKPGAVRNRWNDRIIGAVAGRSSAPSYRGELDAKIEGLLTAGAPSGEDLRSLIAALEERYGEDLRRRMSTVIGRIAGGTSGFDEDDIVQDMWLKASRHLASGNGRHLRQVRSWLMRSTRNCLIDHIRQRRSEMATFRELFRIADHTSPDPAEAASDRERSDLLERALDELDERERTIVTARYTEGLSSSEIAEELGMPASTVRRKLRRTLARVKELIGNGSDVAD